MHRRKKCFKQVLAGTLAVGMVAMSALTTAPTSKVQAADSKTEDEWAKVSAMLDEYVGVYTKDTNIAAAADTIYGPDGPFMGNGLLYEFMGVDAEIQNIYISRGDMWQDYSEGQEYTTFGGITVGLNREEDENLALNKTITVSGYINSPGTVDHSPGEYMVDGDMSTKWCATSNDNNGSTVYWAMIDLGEEKDISRWVVKHAQAGGEPYPELNTRDFKLQYTTEENPDGADDTDWQDADVVEGSTDSVTDRNLATPIKTRYVRLLVNKATQNENNVVRIYELELYAEPLIEEENPCEFRYEHDMKNAEVRALSENGFQTRSWISANENLMVTEITNTLEEPLDMEVQTWTANANTTAEVKDDVMIATKAGISEATDRPSGTGTWEGFTVNIAMASKLLGDVEQTVTNVDDHKNETTFTLEPGQTVTLVSSVQGGKQEGDTVNTHEAAIEQAVDRLNTRLTTEALAEANEKHLEFWKEYWLKSYIDIQDEKIERMYYGMLYMLGCATSVENEDDAGVFGGQLYPWTAADHPAWQGDYTTNTDMQRQAHPLVQANRAEGMVNYATLLEQYWPEAQRRAESAKDLNWVIQGTGRTEQFTEGIEGGALFPTHIGPWGASTEQKNNYGEYWNSPANASSALMPLVKMWQYYQDEEFLEDTLYPMMKSVAIFWENYVTYEDGKYVVYGATHESVPGRNPIFDVDACKYMLKNTILAANELGVDQDKVEIWQNILDNMSPVPTFIYNGKETICDVEGRTQNNTGHTFDSNPVTIQSVYYYDSIGMTASDEEKEKYINYLDVKNGIGSPRRLMSATRLGYDINEIMDQLKIGSLDPVPTNALASGLRANNTVVGAGYCSLLGVVQDSLLQSNEDFINIFANWYDDQETSFRRMRAKGAFLVDADMNEFGQTTYAYIYSEKGKDCSVLNPWQGQELEVYEDGKLIKAEISATNSLGDVYTFATKAGSTYELKPKGGLSLKIDLDKEELTLWNGRSSKLTATTNATEEIVWASDNNNVAVVGKDGTVTAVGAGTTTIRATVSDTVFAECKVTVNAVATESTNIAPLGTATASSHHESFTADRAINGDWNVKYEGWVSANRTWEADPQRWLMVDLGEEYLIDRWLLRLDGHRQTNSEDPNGEHKSNNGDYYLQISEDGNTWEDIDSVQDNRKNTIDRTLDEAVTARYVRIMIEDGEETFARIGQLELYGVLAPAEMPSVEEIEGFEGISVEFGTPFEKLNLPSQASVKLSNGGYAYIPVNWSKGTYDENKSGEYTVSGTLQLPATIANPDNLTATVTVKVNVPATAKELLRKTYDYALALSTDGATDSAKEYFEKALANAKEVLENPDATQEVINQAWNDLVDAIHGLGVVKGDLTYLELLIDKAESMMADKDKYVDTNWQKLVDELAEAKEVYNNGDALQEDIDKAVDELLEVILTQRYKANKENLKELIEKTDAMDLAGYTQESVAVLKNALANAKAVMADESLSVDDQNKVDVAEKELNDAIQNLVKASKEDNNGNNGTTGDNTGSSGDSGNGGKVDDSGKTDAPKTGDTFHVMFWLAGLLIAMVTAYVLVRRRVKKRF